MVLERPAYVDDLAGRRLEPDTDRVTAADLVSWRCISCHTLERVHRYKDSDWDRVVGRMRAYGTRMTDAEAQTVIDYLQGTTTDLSQTETANDD
jgi:mono/diheme cytochrome c family protein